MKTIITILATLACPAIAGADTITQIGSLSGVGGPQTQPLVVAAFDDMGGMRQLGGQTNSSGIPTHVTVDLIAEYSLNSNLLVATHAMIDITMPNNGPLIAFSVFDTDTQTGNFNQPVDLAPWIGTGNLTLDVFTSFLIVETPPGSLSFGAGGSVNYELVYEYENLVIPYCTATPNSTGVSATIDVDGGLSVSANTTLLVGADLPPSQTAVFIYGDTPAQTPFGDGFLCLSLPAGIVRLWPPATISPSGQLVRPLVYTQLPSQGQITPGSTWNFQLYYRDPFAAMSGFNLTPGLELTFLP